MNKKVKYILGYIAILILALVCTFGFIKYNQIKNNKQENNSQNLGSVDGKQVDKETTIIIEDGNVGVNEIIGAYKISKGNLESTNEDLQLVGAKYSDKNDLK